MGSEGEKKTTSFYEDFNYINVDCRLCARNHALHAVRISYRPHNLCTRCSNKGSETVSNLVKVTQLVNTKYFESRSF